MLVLVCLDISDQYLFHLIVLLNPVFNCCKSFLSSLLDKVTTGTYNFVSVILNVAPIGALTLGTGESVLGSTSCVVSSVIIKFLDQAKVKCTSHLINGLFNVVQKLLTCFKGTENLTPFLFPSLAVFPVIFALYLKDSEFVIGSADISFA